MLFYPGPVDYRPRRPRSTPFTILLVLLWLLLAGYIVTHPDPIGIIILMVMAIFIAGPALFIIVGTRRAEREQRDDLTYNSSRDMANGHHRHPPVADDIVESDANTTQREFPDEGGENL